MADAFRLRHEVFVIEQGFPVEVEIDANDRLAEHFVAFDGACVVATMRLVPAGAVAVLGRVAVRADLRRRGIGTGLVRRSLAHATARGFRQAALNSELDAVAFYEHLGFTPVGAVFDDAGVDHVRMTATLAGSTGEPIDQRPMEN